MCDHTKDTQSPHQNFKMGVTCGSLSKKKVSLKRGFLYNCKHRCGRKNERRVQIHCQWGPPKCLDGRVGEDQKDGVRMEWWEEAELADSEDSTAERRWSMSSKRPSRGSDHNGAGHRRRIDSGDTAGVFGRVLGYRSIVKLVRERFRIMVSVIDCLSERVVVSNYKYFYCVLFLTHVILLFPGSMMVELFGGSPVAAWVPNYHFGRHRFVTVQFESKRGGGWARQQCRDTASVFGFVVGDCSIVQSVR